MIGGRGSSGLTGEALACYSFSKMKRNLIRRWYVFCANGNWFPSECHVSAFAANHTRKRADKDFTGRGCGPHRVVELREVRRKS